MSSNISSINNSTSSVNSTSSASNTSTENSFNKTSSNLDARKLLQKQEELEQYSEQILFALSEQGIFTQDDICDGILTGYVGPKGFQGLKEGTEIWAKFENPDDKRQMSYKFFSPLDSFDEDQYDFWWCDPTFVTRKVRMTITFE